MILGIKLFDLLVIVVGFQAIQCSGNCDGYINGSQLTLGQDDFAIKWIQVDRGTNVTFYLRDAHSDCEPQSNYSYYWHAGRKRIIYPSNSFSIESNVTNNGCIHSLTVTVQLKPPENVIYFTNDSRLELICSPGYSLAEYFVLDSDTCPRNGTSCCLESSNTTSELNTTGDRVKTLTTLGPSMMLPSSVITPMSVSGTFTPSPMNFMTATSTNPVIGSNVSKVVIVTIPVLLSIIVISMAVILTMIGLYLIWRRRNGQEGNAPEIHTSNITMEDQPMKSALVIDNSTVTKMNGNSWTQ